MGLPWREHGRARDGVDCWGLVRLVYLSRGIELPSCTEGYASVAELSDIAAALSDHFDNDAGPWRKVSDQRAYDVAIFRRGRYGSHVGVITSPWRMLHINVGDESHITSIRDGAWAPRLVGIYRHREVTE